MPDFTSQRAYPRHKFVHRIQLVTQQGISVMQTTDLSLGGLGIIGECELLKGSDCQAHFAIPTAGGRTIIVVQCRVAYCTKSEGFNLFRMGLEFIGMAEVNTQLLKFFLAVLIDEAHHLA